MVRSGSCFRLIACGGHSADNDDVLVSENKKSGDKKGWSFRKKSDHPRVLSNTATTEKESQEPAAVKFQLQDGPVDPVKTSLAQGTDDEKPVLTVSELEVTEPAIVSIKEAEGDLSPDDSHVIFIQTAIRGILAQRELGKLKNVVKLQAAVRGHLARRHAVGTLRCVQAIVKMQALVRARYARQSLERNHEEDLGKVAQKPNVAGSSIKKHVNTRFARQLLESAPKTKPIRIKCDPMKPNSAWNWLERWVSVSSVEQTERPDSRINQSERGKSENDCSPVDNEVPSEAFGNSAGTKSDGVTETIVPSDGEENLITYDATNLKFEQCQATSEATNDSKHPHLESSSESNMVKTSVEPNTISNGTAKSDADPQTDVSPLPQKPEVEIKPRKHSMKRSASERLETEGKKFMPGSRKASNPSFIAAQSKFEELSSVSKSSGSITTSDVTSKPNMDTAKSVVESFLQAKESSNMETNATNISGVQLGGSECGTELSVTSTLDSPDSYNVGTVEHCEAAKASKRQRDNGDGVEVKSQSKIPMPDSSDLVSNQLGDLSCDNGETMNSAELVDSLQVEDQPQKHTSGIQRELDTANGDQPYRSPEASPRSRMTVQESQGTPASEASVKSKKGKREKSNQKRKSLSATKGSPANPTPESGVRSSTEQVAKDQKNGKRRDSFGSSRPEHADQEPRDSNSSHSVPHFMQGTESARAKINAGSSPRSSPDVQDQDIYVKKRHSLPGANGRQGSPRIQRSMSQAQQNAKGNERKWQR